jgi:hypothetical protein
MTKNLHSKIETGDKLISWAWRLEYVFVALGLLVALSILLGSVAAEGEIKDLTTAQWSSLIVGSAVWFAVAFTELLKIPVTKGLVYAKNIFVKIGTAAFLLFICFITFESMSTGLERSVSIREHDVNLSRSAIDEINKQEELINEKISYKAVIDENQLKINAYAGVEVQVDAINGQVLQLKQQIADLRNPSATDEINELKDQGDYLKSENAKLAESILFTTQTYDEKLKMSYTNEQNEVATQVFSKNKTRAKYSDLRQALINERDAIIAGYQESMTNNDLQLAALNTKVAQLTSLDPKAMTLIESYNAKINQLTDEKASIYADIDKRIAAKVAASEISGKEREQLLDEKAELIAKRNEHIADINANGHDFIYSMAKRVYGAKEVADLTPAQVNSVALVLIFSLAGVVAFSGPILTLLAMNNYLEETQPQQKNKLKTRIGALLVDLRRRLRQPKIIKEVIEREVEKEVEVIKEVPVEKIVKEVIEVPQLIETTKYVGVPVPTNPEDLPTMDEAMAEPKLHQAVAVGGVQ